MYSVNYFDMLQFCSYLTVIWKWLENKPSQVIKDANCFLPLGHFHSWISGPASPAPSLWWVHCNWTLDLRVPSVDSPVARLAWLRENQMGFPLEDLGRWVCPWWALELRAEAREMGLQVGRAGARWRSRYARSPVVSERWKMLRAFLKSLEFLKFPVIFRCTLCPWILWEPPGFFPSHALLLIFLPYLK